MEFLVLKGNKFGAKQGNFFCSLGLEPESLGRLWWWSVGTSNLGFIRLAGGTEESAEHAEAAIVAWLTAYQAKADPL